MSDRYSRVAQLLEGLPQYQPGRNRDVERVFSALLWYLDAHVGRIDNILSYPVNLITGYDCYACIGIVFELREVNAPLYLFEHCYGVSIPAQGLNGLHSVAIVYPLN